MGEVDLLNSKALTKIQSIILISVIIVAAVSSVTIYILLSEQKQPYPLIKIGILADLDAAMGKDGWQASVLAVEQVNAEGGILGREVEVIGEDTDSESSLDMVKINSALTRLITFHKVDFIVGIGGGDVGFGIQDIIAEHKKIMLSVGQTDAFTQRVLDDYDKYKYFFRVNFNHSIAFQGITDGLLLLREQTGFNKVGYLGEDVSGLKGIMEGLDYVLPEVYNFDLVYKGAFPPGTVDFSSYFAAAEAAGVEVLVPLIVLDDGIPFTREWYDRASPLLVYGGVLLPASDPESWDWLDGKCEDIAVSGLPLSVGYPMTTKTLSSREAYIDRWGSTPGWIGALFYDIVRFILPDAIRSAGTIETDAVIEALEETSIETSNARNFVFTKSHDVMIGENPYNPEADHMLVLYFQWQDGEMVPVYPKKIMEEADATLTFPDWPGPWDDIS